MSLLGLEVEFLGRGVEFLGRGVELLGRGAFDQFLFASHVQRRISQLAV